MVQLERKNIGNMLCLVVILMLLFALVACSGGGNDTAVNVPAPVPPRPTEAPEINQATSFSGPLTQSSQEAVSRFIKNGIYSATRSYAIDTREESSPAPVVSLDSSGSGFSTTNTQEQGVDEADRIEYSGETLYLAAYPDWRNESDNVSRVRVLNRNSDFSMEEVAELPVADSHANINGIYLHEERLAVLSADMQVYTLRSFAPEPWNLNDNKTTLDIYDTSSSVTPVIVNNFKIDGTMLSSRRIDNQLYIVTSYTATVEGLNPDATTKEELLDNYLTILDTPTAELMPKIYINGDDGSPLNAPEDCAIPVQATEKDGYAHLLSVVRINLVNNADVSASCISSVAEMIYMSESNIYLSSSVDNQTVLHKVSLDNELTYQATGTVEGVIGWRSAPNLRLSERNNILRIVSSDYSEREPVHRLSVLEQQGSVLTTISTLPNSDNPEPIGKPGEDIFAVRFFDDRAYIVTFERIDPLYIIDLANPRAPNILGSLEIPGFSSYLHPLENGYLLGVGQQVNARNIPENGTIPVEPVTQEGMKVSLFDVSDPANPMEINHIVKANAYTPVEYDYRALSVLNRGGNYQLAMPLEAWDSTSDIARYVNALMLLEIDTTAARPELILRNEMYASDNDGTYIFSGEDRSVIHGSHVYYIHGNQVFHAEWAEGAKVRGPF